MDNDYEDYEFKRDIFFSTIEISEPMLFPVCNCVEVVTCLCCSPKICSLGNVLHPARIEVEELYR